jgi:catechol 2,3-dioxygenase-like lactoylglutathione lyase family enzyme
MAGLTGLSHAGFASSNLERTMEFYTKVLGAKVQWQTERQIKLYVGDLGLAIPLGTPNPQYDMHFGYRADPDNIDETIAHVESCGIEVDGPHGHGAEPQNISWFFTDPDGYRLEIECHYPNLERVIMTLDRDHGNQKPELGLFRGGDARDAVKEQQAKGYVLVP